jgi:hypothetical protein
MPKRLGLIQSRGIGDIVIALPIAAYYAKRGYEVIWPISEHFINHFRDAVDYVEFVSLEEDSANRWYYDTPLSILQHRGCDKIIPLYNALRRPGYPVRRDLARSLHFDEYKFKVAKVPFKEKWNLRIKRNSVRELDLFEQEVQSERYILIQQQASDARVDIAITGHGDDVKIVEITEKTDCIFDWLTIIERASTLIMIDSCFLNLVNQLSIGPTDRYYIAKASTQGTPILGPGWRMISAPIRQNSRDTPLFNTASNR